jgi:hypothetical protein
MVEGMMKTLQSIMGQLSGAPAADAALQAPGAPAAPAPAPAPEKPLDALSQLEAELGGNPAPAAPASEASRTLPPEQIKVDAAPEDPNAKKEEAPAGASTCDTLRAVIREIRPTLAKLPEAQRAMVGDALTVSLRKAMGQNGTPDANALLNLAKVAAGSGAKVNDSAVDMESVGQRIMEKNNPHYMKKQ